MTATSILLSEPVVRHIHREIADLERRMDRVERVLRANGLADYLEEIFRGRG